MAIGQQVECLVDGGSDVQGRHLVSFQLPPGLGQTCTERQTARLADIAATNQRLYRAYLLKEQLRQVFVLKGADGIALLDPWLRPRSVS